MARSRRWFLLSLPAACFAAETSGKGRTFPSAVTRYSDLATEFTVSRLSDPAHTSRLPAYYCRAVARHSNFLVFSSDLSGRFEAFRLDLKSGHSRQLTEADDLDPGSLTLLSDDHGFCYFDGNRLVASNLSSLRSREVYRIPEGFERGRGSNVAEDGQYAVVVEKKGAQHRLQLVHVADGTVTKLVECDEEISDPIPRPRRASVLYRRGGATWLSNYDAQQNYRLRFADGETGPEVWSPDGRTVLYLNYPEDVHKLHNLREFTPDTNEEKMVANTSQFVHFGSNADASVFVGASGSKASPHVLLLVRAVKRELTLAEHRASNPQMVAPIFAPNSQRVFWTSDLHGKPAIYSMSVEKLVEETDAND
jgi:oligogalacturonide lyase